MAKYVVTYQETLARTLIVEGNSYDDAMDKLMNAVERGDVELTMEDYQHDSGCILDITPATDVDERWYRNLDEFTN